MAGDPKDLLGGGVLGGLVAVLGQWLAGRFGFRNEQLRDSAAVRQQLATRVTELERRMDEREISHLKELESTRGQGDSWRTKYLAALEERAKDRVAYLEELSKAERARNEVDTLVRDLASRLEKAEAHVKRCDEIIRELQKRLGEEPPTEAFHEPPRPRGRR